MTRADLIEVVRETLSRAGFTVSERCDLRPVSFDLVARRDKELRMVKVLSNVDALSEAIAQEIKVLCKFLDARPILVGLRSGTGNLEPGVVYNRHDIPIMTPETLEQVLLHGEPPMVFAAPGGFYVQLDAAALRRAREDAQLSLGMMAQIAGVSRRAIQMYEEGMSASIDAAMRLEEFLQSELIRPINPFDAFDPSAFQPKGEPQPTGAEDPMEGLVRRMLESLGYEVRATRRSPFNAITTQEADTFLTGMGEDSPQLRRRARVVTSVSQVTGRPGFFVIERTTRTSIEGMPVVTRTELKRLDDPEAILQLILERQGREPKAE
ncbi:MAG: putative transcriptional regulator [Thermoplasmata archaeon]|jgi:putative transcriptional regulator|nr:putative transcriptional regulator [Thermoplasmata archaeon]